MGLIWMTPSTSHARRGARRLRERGRVRRQDGSGPLINGLLSQVKDIDTAETQEWLESLDGLIDERGGPRARYMLLNMLRRARQRNIAVPGHLTTPYVNTI